MNTPALWAVAFTNLRPETESRKVSHSHTLSTKNNK